MVGEIWTFRDYAARSPAGDLLTPGEHKTDPETDEHAAGQPPQGVSEARVLAQSIAQDTREEGDGAEDDHAEEREDQAEGQKPEGRAARLRARELRQERQEKHRHLGVEKVHGQAL